MTNEVTVLVKPTPIVCQDCVDNSRHQSEEVGIVWCDHHKSGGIYMVDTARWHVMGPFDDESEFKRCLAFALSPRVARH